MAKKRKSNKKLDPNVIPIPARSGEDKGVVIARSMLRPTVQAAVTLREYGKAWEGLELSGLIDSLKEQTDAVTGGDLKRGEAMLTAQAHTLDAIFNTLSRRSVNAELMETMETYLKLGLRAQSQCRATWEVLATMKNPPVAGYVRQANIAQGPQQVNNAPPLEEDVPRARGNSKPQNKLLEENDDERLDTGATGMASKADPAMAAVGKINGT
jgi:hypothetical protein